MENIEAFLGSLGLKIEKKEIKEEEKTLISYFIKNQYSNDDSNHGLLSIWVSNKDEDKMTRQLDTTQRRKFKYMKKISIPLYCYISWINGSKIYKHFGKLLMFYMMLDLSQNNIFVIKLDNSSGKKDTYKIFGFVDFQNDEEEIMSSILLPTILKNMRNIYK